MQPFLFGFGALVSECDYNWVHCPLPLYPAWICHLLIVQPLHRILHLPGLNHYKLKPGQRPPGSSHRTQLQSVLENRKYVQK